MAPSFAQMSHRFIRHSLNESIYRYSTFISLNLAAHRDGKLQERTPMVKSAFQSSLIVKATWTTPLTPLQGLVRMAPLYIMLRKWLEDVETWWGKRRCWAERNPFDMVWHGLTLTGASTLEASNAATLRADLGFVDFNWTIRHKTFNLTPSWTEPRHRFISIAGFRCPVRWWHHRCHSQPSCMRF